MQLAELIQALYSSEINVSISSFWDGGWDVKVGDIRNGFKSETTVLTVAEIVPWLIQAAITTYPGSDFAKTRATNQGDSPDA